MESGDSKILTEIQIVVPLFLPFSKSKNIWILVKELLLEKKWNIKNL